MVLFIFCAPRGDRDFDYAKSPGSFDGALSKLAVLNSVQTHAFDAPAPVFGADVVALHLMVSVCMMAGPYRRQKWL
tara:strand:- start:11992 stop:12219 length:228 start_codon:yes stop_codon:yes gene_type:complete